MAPNLTQFSIKLKRNPHTEQFLSQQLSSIRHIHLYHIFHRVTDPAIRPADLLASGDRPLDHARHSFAPLAHMHFGAVAECEKPFVKVSRGSMGYEAVTFHLSELDPTESFPVCHWLSGERVYGTRVSELHFVLGHVDQPLVKGGAHENKGFHDFTCSTVV